MKLISIIILLLNIVSALRGAENEVAVKEWFDKQGKQPAFEVAFVQERKLKGFRRVIQTPGRLFFSPPMSYRWELGDPLKTIAVGNDSAMYVLDVAKKTATTWSRDQLNEGKNAEFFHGGIPKDWEGMKGDFSLKATEINPQGKLQAFELSPSNTKLAIFIFKLRFVIAESGDLKELEVVMRDDSRLITRFNSQEKNKNFPKNTFTPDLIGYEVKEGK